MELLAVPRVKGKVTYQSYIIANSTNSAANISQLKGRSFAFTDPMSFSGRIAPVFMLEQRGISIDGFFGRSFFTYSHDNSIQAVSGGIVEAAAVDSMIYDRALEKNPTLRNSTRIVDRSLTVGNPPVVIAPGMDRELLKTMQDILLGMHGDKAGQTALDSLEYDRFIEPDEDLYAELVRIWMSLREKL
jgi:phosphonate transport system substrate-binding protein